MNTQQASAVSTISALQNTQELGKASTLTLGYYFGSAAEINKPGRSRQGWE
jgi:hypothetical protein